ncbi:phosphoenolpyruvate--protein phosphotransferase [soil metagenome]
MDKAKAEVQELGRAVTARLDAQQASIFDAHVQLLSDPLLIDRTVSSIRTDHRNADFIFWNVTKEIGEQLSSLGDAYFSERTHDIYDVARRVIKFIGLLKNPHGSTIPEGSIVVANDLGPSETAQLRRDKIAGFCTNSGGPASHTAIMAKALKLPAVVGLDFITHYVRTGDFMIVDGTDGAVILNPTKEQIEYYRGVAAQYDRDRDDLEGIRELPAETICGQRVALEANIEFSSELAAVLHERADGIGLFRTEYFFIDRSTLPTEEEQETAYRDVMEAMHPANVVLRTLDVGGDKLASTIPLPVESNPFLGLRAIRLCLAYPDLFKSQLRPMIRAASGREIHILLPMVSGIEEVLTARKLIDSVSDELRKNGVAMPTRILVGAMIEIPSAALQARAMAKHVDFFSIGTNDLTQYTLAVDRVNKMVGNLYHETHPAVLHLIQMVVRAGAETGTPVTVCGEMAGDPTTAALLIGMGVRSLSMSPSLISQVKKMIRSVDIKFLEGVAEKVLCMTTGTEVREALEAEIDGALTRQNENELRKRNGS